MMGTSPAEHVQWLKEAIGLQEFLVVLFLIVVEGLQFEVEFAVIHNIYINIIYSIPSINTC